MFVFKSKKKKILPENKLKDDGKLLLNAAQELSDSINDINATLVHNSLNLYQENIKNIIHILNDPAVLIDSTGKIKSFNDNIITCFRYPSNELIDKNITELLQYRCCNEKDEISSKHLKKIKAKRSNGEEFPVSISIADIITPKKENLHLCIIRDLSNQVIQEQCLQRQECFFYEVMDNLPIGIFLKNKYNEYTFVNDYFQKIFLINKKDIIGKTDEDILNQDLSLIFKNNKKRNENIFEYKINEKHFLIGKKYLNKDQCENIMGFMIDITNEKNALDFINIEKTKFKTLFEFIPYSICILNENKTIKEINKKMLNIIDCISYNEVSNLNVTEIINEKYNTLITNMLDKAKSNNEIFYDKIILEFNNKSIDCTVNVMYDINIGYILIFNPL